MKNAKPMRLESYTLRIEVRGRGADRGLRGVVEHPSCEVPIAFNGLFELWHAIHHFGKTPDPTIKRRLG
jgi:hypothetical protein